MVISGINAGPIWGDDTIYSGTVAAATEGFLLGTLLLPILAGEALSHYETAAQVVARFGTAFCPNKPIANLGCLM